MADERDLELLESVYDALEDGDAACALAAAERGLAEVDDADPVLSYLAGRALLELDRPDEAVTMLERATEVDAEDPEFRAHLAWALFRCCRFTEAEQQAERAIDSGDDLPEAHYVRGLTLERSRRFDEADRHFARAARLDSEGFRLPVRLGEAEFRREVERATAELRSEFRDPLGEVGLMVEDVPSDAVLHDSNPPLDPELLGLFVGIPRGLSGHDGPGGELPPRIYLFQRNLERHSIDAADLREQIRITLYHELGHYLGMEESELEALDYG